MLFDLGGIVVILLIYYESLFNFIIIKTLLSNICLLVMINNKVN